MRIVRHFTRAGMDPLASVAFKYVDVDFCHSSPEEHCCITDLEVPSSWSYAASQLFAKHFLAREALPALTLRVNERGMPKPFQRSVADKEALSALPPDQRVRFESSARQVFYRMAGAWTYHGFKAGYFDTVDDAQAFYDELVYMLAHQIAAPNAMQWRQNGMYWAYGVEGRATNGFAVVDEGTKLVKATRAYVHPQLHAAVLQGCKPSVGEDALAHLVERDRKAMKVGASSGCNLSALSAWEGNDAVSVLTAREKAAVESKAKGLSRKPMMMCVLDAEHRDVESLLRFKPEEHYKAAAMMLGARTLRKYLAQVLSAAIADKGDEADAGLRRALKEARNAMIPHAAIARVLAYAREGFTEVHIPVYGVEDDSELFATVGGHHTQIAVRMTDIQVASNAALIEEWEHSAWAGAEPTLMFADTIARWHTCPEVGTVQALSPGAEFAFVDNTALPLAALNADAFVKDDGAVAFDALAHASRLMSVMLDISVDMAQYPTRDVARQSADTRPLGLSMTNIATALMRQGVAYDSEAGRTLAAALVGIMTAEAYGASAEMAKDLGAFKHYDANRASMMTVLGKHRAALQALPVCDDALHGALHMARRAWDQALIWAEAYGVRNAHTTCIGPMQTVTRLMDAATLGMEPMRQLVYLAPQREGKARKYVHEAVMAGLVACGYGVEERADMMAHLLGHGTLRGCAALTHAQLRDKGFGDAEIAAVEDALKESLQIEAAFDPWVVGERFCRTVLKLQDRDLFDASFHLLRHLGFSAEAIARADAYACGAKTMQGAPHLQPQHAAVFATYAPERAVPKLLSASPESQIELMAALQPAVSGGISHPVVLPFDARMEMFGMLARKAHALGVKSVALTRYAAQLYAEVRSDTAHDEYEADNHTFAVVHESAIMAPAALAKHFAMQAVTARRELPQRRAGFTQKVKVGGHTLYLRTGEYDSGEVGEVFVDMPGMSEEYRNLMQQYARLVSIALQYGVSLQTLARAFCDVPFAPAGMVEGSTQVNHAYSVLDYIFRELMQSYGDVAQSAPEDRIEDAPELQPASPVMLAAKAV